VTCVRCPSHGVYIDMFNYSCSQYFPSPESGHRSNYHCTVSFRSSPSSTAFPEKACCHSPQVAQLEAQLARLGAGIKAEVTRHRKTVIEEILTLKCPRVRCRLAFVDFDGCFALSCKRCGCGFCAYCLEDCGADAHRHVANCPYNTAPGKSLHASFGAFERAHRERRLRKLAEYVKREVPGDSRAAVVEAMQKDLRDIGIDVARLRRDCGL
jgi:hypothetical protein